MKRFRQDAKVMVDSLFDGKIFKDGITRDDMNLTEDYIFEMMTNSFDSHLKCQKLIESINKNKK